MAIIRQFVRKQNRERGGEREKEKKRDVEKGGNVTTDELHLTDAAKGGDDAGKTLGDLSEDGLIRLF